MKKILLAAVIVVVVAVGAIFFFIKNKASNTENQAQESLEKVDSVKFEENFRSIYLGKIAASEQFAPQTVPTIAFSFETGKDQYCTVLEAKKIISAGSYASAICKSNSDECVKPKTAFSGSFSEGTTAGCGVLPATAGTYEYRAYLDDVLVSVIPFEILAPQETTLPPAHSPSVSPSGNSPKPVLEFVAGGCDQAMDPYTEPWQGISGQSWANNVLTVSAFLKTLCEGITFSGDYQLNGNNLALSVSLSHGVIEGECYCARKLTYKISNIENKNYSISIHE
jgi:hypothetical protein